MGAVQGPARPEHTASQEDGSPRGVWEVDRSQVPLGFWLC